MFFILYNIIFLNISICPLKKIDFKTQQSKGALK